MILEGTVRLEIVCADIIGFLNICQKEIILRDIAYRDMLTATIIINRVDLERLEKLSKRYGAKIRQRNRYGVFWTIIGLKYRPVLIIGMILILLFMCWLPSRVLFITVEGNTSVPTKYILEKAEQCGIAFGASRRGVRSEKMKNALLASIHQLQWAGINTKGCTAVITVKERTIEESDFTFRGISSIVAARDGIIASCNGVKGNTLCKVGQAVHAGDVLISAYTDVGLCVTATQATGEVFAQTLRHAEVCMPINYIEKGSVSAQEKKYGLLIGKKRINFYKGSGISGTSCDKIYLEYYVTLPGGFVLPFGVFVSKSVSYEASTAFGEDENLLRLAEDVAKQYLLSQMVSGKILLDSVRASSEGEVVILSGKYVCLEMIGRVQYEENTHSYGEDNRENR